MDWKKVILWVVVALITGATVVLGIYFGTRNIGKTVVVEQVVAKEGVEEEKAPETVVEETEAPTETEEITTLIETSVGEEKAIETTEAVSVVPEGVIPPPYESEGGIPYSGSEWGCDVAPDEIEVLSVGPGECAGVEFKGGANPDRGGIFIFLPGEQVIRYQVKKLIGGSNWHGAYDYNRVPKENDWKALVDDRVKAMMQAPNGTSGKGCQIVDVAVIGPDGVVLQLIKNKIPGKRNG